MVEMDKTTMTETGRVHLRLVRNRSGETLENFIRSAVRRGTTIVTDEWAGYNFLDAEDSGYHHVNSEPLGERKDNGRGPRYESRRGLFSRVRRFLRANYTRMPSREAYGLLLAEYCWRKTTLGRQVLPERTWPAVAFWRLAATLREVVDEQTLLDLSSHLQEDGVLVSDEGWRWGTHFEYLIPDDVRSTG